MRTASPLCLEMRSRPVIPIPRMALSEPPKREEIPRAVPSSVRETLVALPRTQLREEDVRTRVIATRIGGVVLDVVSSPRVDTLLVAEDTSQPVDTSSLVFGVPLTVVPTRPWPSDRISLSPIPAQSGGEPDEVQPAERRETMAGP